MIQTNSLFQTPFIKRLIGYNRICWDFFFFCDQDFIHNNVVITFLVRSKKYSRQQSSALVDWKQVLFFRRNSYIHSNNKFSFRWIVCFFSLATNIKSIFSTAVDRFNEAGCLQWIPRTTETEYIRVVGNEAR